MNERAQAMERRLEWPLLAATLLTIPAIVSAGCEITPSTWRSSC